MGVVDEHRLDEVCGYVPGGQNYLMVLQYCIEHPSSALDRLGTSTLLYSATRRHLQLRYLSFHINHTPTLRSPCRISLHREHPSQYKSLPLRWG